MSTASLPTLLRCCIVIDGPSGIASRLLPPAPHAAATHGGGSRGGNWAAQPAPSAHPPPPPVPVTQTLVSFFGSRELRPLLGADGHEGLELGPPLQLFEAPGAATTAANAGGAGVTLAAPPRRPFVAQAGFGHMVWCPCTASLYIIAGQAILRLTGDDGVSLVAGHASESVRLEGRGASARFGALRFLTADGRGSLYAADGTRLRRVRLPAAWRVAAAADGSGGGGGGGGGRGGGGGGSAEENGEGEGEADAETEAVVSTLPFEAAAEIWGLAFDASREMSVSDVSGGDSAAGAAAAASDVGGGAGSLVYNTDTALYRVPLGAGGAGGMGPEPWLLAGNEFEAGTANGRGEEARFLNIFGLVVDGEGCVYLADRDVENGVSVVRRATPDGAVRMVAQGLANDLGRPAILPNGYLALCSYDVEGVHVLGTRLRPPRCHAAATVAAAAAAAVAAAAAAAAAAAEGAAGAGGSARTLAADWGALLERALDGSSDLTIVVAEQPFAVHKLVLTTRCDYFRQRLAEGTFSDGAAATLSLPDADPDAFALLLRFLYTGASDVPPGLAQAVAELADRLLLPELCRVAQAQVLAVAAPETVVGALLWADACGPAFSQLLSDLKAWYLKHQEEVVEQASDSLRRLREAPDLAVELLMASARRGARR